MFLKKAAGSRREQASVPPRREIVILQLMTEGFHDVSFAQSRLFPDYSLKKVRERLFAANHDLEVRALVSKGD